MFSDIGAEPSAPKSMTREARCDGPHSDHDIGVWGANEIVERTSRFSEWDVWVKARNRFRDRRSPVRAWRSQRGPVTRALVHRPAEELPYDTRNCSSAFSHPAHAPADAVGGNA